jgi:glycerol-3-phosphate acyltransferase PlsY
MFAMLHHAPVWLMLLLTVGGGYLLGSIPFGLIAARLGGAGDIRQIGSGNIGATNVLRTGRRDLALITLVCDAGKGIAAALLARAAFGEPADTLAAGAAFLGHLFPVWLGFKGGRGVATFFGVLFAIVWPVGLAAGATWLIVAAIARLSSLASLTAALLAPLFLVVLGLASPGWATVPRLVLLAVMALLIIARHEANIRRLLKGEEPRIGASKAGAAS